MRSFAAYVNRNYEKSVKMLLDNHIGKLDSAERATLSSDQDLPGIANDVIKNHNTEGENALI